MGAAALFVYAATLGIESNQVLRATSGYMSDGTHPTHPTSIRPRHTESAGGDLARCLGMKWVGIAGLVVDAAIETKVPSKSFALAGQLGKKISFLDSKYKIKDRIFAAGAWAVNRASGAAQEANSGGGPEERGSDGRSERPPAYGAPSRGDYGRDDGDAFHSPPHY